MIICLAEKVDRPLAGVCSMMAAAAVSSRNWRQPESPTTGTLSRHRPKRILPALAPIYHLCCPCRRRAVHSSYCTTHKVATAIDISKYSENGVVFEPDTEHTAGTIRYETHIEFQSINSECALSSLFCSHPTPFKCTIQARSRKALDLINEERFS